MVESFIHKNLADKRKEIQAYIGSLAHRTSKWNRLRSERCARFNMLVQLFTLNRCALEGPLH